MAWQQLHFTLAASEVDLLSELLFAAEALSVSCEDPGDQPIYEPKHDTALWATTELSALFPQDCDLQAVLEQLRLGLAPQSLPPYRISQLDDALWERAWLEHFKPICIQDRLWICPSESEKPKDDKPVLWLDPGLAFGTGTHPTTALCLEALTLMPLEQLTIMDYGCGSGILAIAALKLGAKKAYAIDHHAQALIASKDNAFKNKISPEALSILEPEDCPKTQYDLWIANILLHPLIDLEPMFAEHLTSGKIILLSGILNQQVDELLQAYQNDFTLLEQQQCEDWALLKMMRH